MNKFGTIAASALSVGLAFSILVAQDNKALLNRNLKTLRLSNLKAHLLIKKKR